MPEGSSASVGKLTMEQVRRIPDRFPTGFMFQVSEDEFKALMSQLATSNDGTAASGRGGRNDG